MEIKNIKVKIFRINFEYFLKFLKISRNFEDFIFLKFLRNFEDFLTFLKIFKNFEDFLTFLKIL